jgi:DNA repair photolyase
VARQVAQRMRWSTVEEERELALPGTGERITHPEFAGIEFLHVRAKSLLNHVPAAAGLPFEWTINVYRGCTHACSYCLAPDTPILLADGRTKPIGELEVGEWVYGTRRVGAYRRYVPTEVRDVWRTVKHAYRVRLADGTELIASGDHRLLSERGWKHVVDDPRAGRQRPHLTRNNSLRGTGGFATSPKPDDDYRRGYLCGMIRGDASLATSPSRRTTDGSDVASRFRLALADPEALERSQRYLEREGIRMDLRVFSSATQDRREILAIRDRGRAAFEAITELIQWPGSAEGDSWWKGFLAGIFDAEGSCSRGVWRLTNGDPTIIRYVLAALERFGFMTVTETVANGCTVIRLLGGLRERLRFFHLTDPAISRKRDIAGVALESDADLRVEAVEDLGIVVPMVDITTGTGDFIANGVVSHNCFARPTHEYLDLDGGRDFESVIVVKVNAVERLRAELRAPRWQGHHVALGTNTDPYQRCEGRYRLTRGVVETLAEAGNSFSVLTKGTLVTRDLDLYAEAARRGVCTGVSMSIPTLDEQVWRDSEPGTPHPRARMEAIAALAEAGVPTGVMIAPIIPGMSDDRTQLDEVVGAAVEAGATSITPIVLHLRPGVRELFEPWLADVRPDLVERYRRLYRGSYAPEAERRRIGALVHELVARHGGTRRAPLRDPERRRDDRARFQPGSEATAVVASEQLSLW